MVRRHPTPVFPISDPAHTLEIHEASKRASAIPVRPRTRPTDQGHIGGTIFAFLGGKGRGRSQAPVRLALAHGAANTLRRGVLVLTHLQVPVFM